MSTRAVQLNLNLPGRPFQPNKEEEIMDKLSKAQKDEMAVSLAALALYDGDVSVLLCKIVIGL